MAAKCGDELTDYNRCRAATREFVRVFHELDCASMMLPMLYLALCGKYDEARVRQRFREVATREWRIRDDQMALAMSYFRESVRMVEADGPTFAIQEEEPNKSAFVRRQVKSNKLLPREQQRGSGTTSEINMRRYLDRALSNHGALVAKWREALSQGNTPREVEAATVLSEYSGQPF